jgi:NAD(P)-dependent dehydrogenase (short-subunit alcohol dehydrogenase family)
MPEANYPSLRDKTVVVTGGGSGIGAALTESFARQGARTYFLDVAVEPSRQLERSLATLPTPPRFVHCDLTDIGLLQDSFSRIAKEAGPVQVLINNAANDDRHRLDDVTPTYWDERIDVNLRHLFFCAQAVAPAMRRARSGVIINLGSISWHLGLHDLTIYQTAKAGIEGMTRAMARELGADGVRVTCVVPGAVRTPRQTELWHTPEEEARILAAQCLKERVEPSDIAGMVLFLASDDARMCTAQPYFVDAGWR